jgi:hypothetical protein
MGVTKTTVSEGSGAYPTKGQTVVIEYTGYLKDTSAHEMKGKKYVTRLPSLCKFGIKALPLIDPFFQVRFVCWPWRLPN